MTEKISILAAPAHYQLNTTSEYGWTFNILNEASKHFPVEFEAITGFDALKEREGNTHLRIQEIFSELNPQPGNRDKLRFIWGYWRRARALLRLRDFDIIHHILPFGYKETFNPLALFGSTKKQPFIIGPVQSPHVFVGEDNPEGGTKTILSKIFEKLCRRTLLRADVIIAINEDSKKTYENFVPGEKIVIISPGIHVHNYESRPTGQDEKNGQFLPVGPLIPRKGITDLLNTLAEVVKKYPDTQLHIVGDGPQKSNLQQLTKEMRLEKNVIFHGQIPHQETARFFQKSDIYCSASLSESFGQVYLEAMACGKPVLSTDNIGAREIVIDGETGFLTPIKNTAAMAKKIIELIEQPHLRQKFGEQGRIRTEENYDWSIISKKYFNMYKDCLDEKSNGAGKSL